jgi:hypothetical protein
MEQIREIYVGTAFFGIGIARHGSVCCSAAVSRLAHLFFGSRKRERLLLSVSNVAVSINDQSDGNHLDSTNRTALSVSAMSYRSL